MQNAERPMGYVILWLVAAAIGELYFLLDQNASRKRAVFPVFMFGLIGAFVVILSFLGAPAGGLIFCTICGVAIALGQHQQGEVLRQLRRHRRFIQNRDIGR